MNIPLIIRARINSSVEMNGLLVPLENCIENLHRFCRQITVYNDYQGHDISLFGSGFLFQHHGHNLVLCSAHQFSNNKRQPDELQIIIDTDNGQIGLTPNLIGKIINNNKIHDDISDILLAEYHNERNGRNLDRYFYKLDLDNTVGLDGDKLKQVIRFFSIGYLSRFTKYEEISNDNNADQAMIVSRLTTIYLTPAQRTAFDKENLAPFMISPESDIRIDDYDGLSGAPVFFLYKDNTGTIKLGFAGMVTQASKEGRFNIIESKHIKEAVRPMLEQQEKT